MKYVNNRAAIDVYHELFLEGSKEEREAYQKEFTTLRSDIGDKYRKKVGSFKESSSEGYVIPRKVYLEKVKENYKKKRDTRTIVSTKTGKLVPNHQLLMGRPFKLDKEAKRLLDEICDEYEITVLAKFKILYHLGN
jgi:hypothetical protein